MSATTSYLHFGCFTRDAILCSIFFFFFFFLLLFIVWDVLFFLFFFFCLFVCFFFFSWKYSLHINEWISIRTRSLNEGQHVFEWKILWKEWKLTCDFDNNIPLFSGLKIHFHTHFRVKFYHSKMRCPPFHSFHSFSNLSTRFTFRE